MRKRTLLPILLAAATAAAQAPMQLPAQAPTPLPAYTPQQQVAGTIHVWGSPQMGDLLKLYEQRFQQFQPAVHFDDDLRSTITAVAGVYTGRADIGLLGREIWPLETQAFASIAGHPPLVVDVATGSLDVPKATFALMAFVPRANPLRSLSTTQLERIFSNAPNAVHTWGELGLTGAWAHRPIHIVGFAIENDKSQIFAQLIFQPGLRWSAALREQVNTGPTDAGELILRAVAADPGAIGISNIHYATPAVQALPLSTPTHPAPITANRTTVADRTYPLTRAVYMVLNAGPAHPLPPAVREFLRFVLSREGAAAVTREANYLPLTESIAAPERHALP